MATQRALIVDDSKTAQIRLAKHLESYEIEIDTAISAEEALGRLSYNIPSVIFMDHHMEGMDGLNALKIIKANPTTAMVPVIMYTSEEDDVYAGQAHALGALDTLCKKILHPASIESALAKLNIHPIGAKRPDTDKKVVPHVNRADIESPASDTPTAWQTTKPEKEKLAHELNEPNQSQGHSGDISHNIEAIKSEMTLALRDEIRKQVSSQLELHASDIRAQLNSNTDFLASKIRSEIKKSAPEPEQPKTDEIPPLEVISEEIEAKASRMGATSHFMLVLILAALALISFQQYKTTTEIDELEDSYAVLTEINAQGNALLDDVITAIAAKSEYDRRPFSNEAVISLINWAVNSDMAFDFNETPLNDEKILNIQNLIFLLNQVNFQGIVELDIHLGNFCVIRSGETGWELAPDDLPVSQCSFIADEKVAAEESKDYITLPYVQFEQSSPPLQNGSIELLLAASEYDNPPFSYPSSTAGLTAKQWNKIATKNNSVTVIIEAAE